MPTIDRAATLACLRRLIAIDSRNPAMEADGPGEAEIARFVAGWLRDAGLEVDTMEAAPGRPNVVARLRGTGGGRSLMLNAHMDTVGVAGMADPFSGEERDGRIHGRGAYDMKGSLAACLAAAWAVAASGERPAGDVVVAAVADEEDASIGTARLIESVRTDGAVVTEPTALNVCVAHKGFAWIEVVVRGRAAHGSRPELGVDANVRMGRVLREVEALADALSAGRAHPLLGHGSVHAAILEGGTGKSTYAELARLVVERRTLPGESAGDAVAEIESALDRLRRADPALDVESRLLLGREPFEVAADRPVVRAAAAAVQAEMGQPPELVGDSPWMDAALLAAAGVETVVLGPAGDGAHAAVEWVDADSVLHLGSILVRMIRDYCG